MLSDLRHTCIPRRALGRIQQADARQLPDEPGAFSAVITSPPYPNRHDYTRVFGVELMFGFLDWEGTKQLRYQSFHSHPEARPVRPSLGPYREPPQLSKIIGRIRQLSDRRRLPDMLIGYFQDAYLCLKEMARVSRQGAPVACVVGNAQYFGQQVPVDELVAQIGEQAGLEFERLLATRVRGNSAQQMRDFGRKPSRESVVLFRKPITRHESRPQCHAC